MNTLVIIGWLLVTTPTTPEPHRAEAQMQSITQCAQAINSVLDAARAGQFPGVNILDAGCEVTQQ